MKKILIAIVCIFFTPSLCGAVAVQSFISADDVNIAEFMAFRSNVVNAINSAEGALLQDATVTTAKLDANANPENRWNEGFSDFVFTGLLPATDTDLTSDVSLGTAYVNGVRVVKAATAQTYSANKFTYVDLSSTGVYTLSAINYGGAVPSIATNSIRLARVSTDGTEIGAVVDLRRTAQPNFNAFFSADILNFVAGSNYTINWNSEVYDVGSNFDTDTDTFTAPVTGKYIFSVNVSFVNIDSASSLYAVYLITSNRTYTWNLDPRQFVDDIVGAYSMGGSVLVDMETDDTAYVAVYQATG